MKSALEIWETALGELELQINKSNYRTWFEKTSGLSYQGDHFVVGVPNTFIAEYLDKSQRSLIEKTLIGLLQKPVTVVFSVNNEQENRTMTYGGYAQLPAPPKQPRLNLQYTFDSFVVSDCNRLAYAAAMGAAAKPGQRSYNPLVIYGGCGLGKTHLLHAMGHVAQAEHKRVLFTSAEQFTNEFVSSIRERSTEDFRTKYRSAEMLLVDDIQFLSGKQQTEESFFHIFNELHNTDRQIAVTSDRPPRSIPLMEERLRSRLEWGLTAGLQPPDLGTRLSILRTKARKEGVNVTPDVLDLIAEHIKLNIRELEGALNRVIAYAKLLGVQVTPTIASEAMVDIAPKQPKLPPPPSLLLETVARYFQIPIPDLKSHKRDKQTVLARQVAMYMLRSETEWSLTQIGKELGDRQAITVSQACRKIASNIEQDTELKQKIAAIQEQVSLLQDEPSGRVQRNTANS